MVLHQRESGHYDLRYGDGEEELDVAPHLVRKVAPSPLPGSTPRTGRSRSKGAQASPLGTWGSAGNREGRHRSRSDDGGRQQRMASAAVAVYSGPPGADPSTAWLNRKRDLRTKRAIAKCRAVQKRLDESLKKVSDLAGRVERRDATIMRLRKRGLLQQQQFPSPIPSPVHHMTGNVVNPLPLSAIQMVPETKSWTPEPGSSTSAKSEKSLEASDEETEEVGLSDVDGPDEMDRTLG